MMQQPFLENNDHRIPSRELLVRLPRAAVILHDMSDRIPIAMSALLKLANLQKDPRIYRLMRDTRRLLMGNTLVVASDPASVKEWDEKLSANGCGIQLAPLSTDASYRPISADERVERYRAMASRNRLFAIITKEYLPELARWHDGTNTMWACPNVVFDELLDFPEHGTCEFQILLKEMLPKADRLIGFSSMEKQQSLRNLWRMLWLIDGGRRLGKTPDEFLSEFFEPRNGTPIPIVDSGTGVTKAEVAASDIVSWCNDPGLQKKLHNYQLVARNFLMEHPKAGLFLDVGFGKTLVTLSALAELASRRIKIGNVLVIAPKAIAKSTWIDEIAKWGWNAEMERYGQPMRQVSLIVNEKGKDLSKQKRLERYEAIKGSDPAVYFINRELVVDLVDWCGKNLGAPRYNAHKNWPFQTVIIDELQGFKSYSASRFKAMRAVSPFIERFIGLTGTPAPNGLMDLWAEIYLMDEGKRLGPNITSYRNEFFDPGIIVDGHPVTWRPKKIMPGGMTAEDDIYGRIRDVVISVKNPDIKLPEITFNDFLVYMSDSEKKIYKDFVKEKILDIQNDDGTVSQIEAQNPAVLTAKLSQLASGAIYNGNGKEYAVLHEHKLDAMEYIINNTGSPVIVAYHFKSDKAEIEKRLDASGVAHKTMDGSTEMIKEWNSGKIPVLLLQPASVGHGINIQEGGHTLIWYTIPWSLEHYIQTIGRIHRQGQKHPVMIHHLLTDGTIDRHILTTVNKKDDSERALMDAVSMAFADL